MSLQGHTTLTNDEKVSEARKHVEYLMEHFTELAPNEQCMVKNLSDNFQRYGAKTMISNKQLFWLRDINQQV
jgi:hypothetical protein